MHDPGNDLNPGPVRRSPVLQPVATSRLLAIMEHVPAYAVDGPSRLGRDAGVARSSVWRIIRGELAPTLRLMVQISMALERHIGRPIEPREILSFTGDYPTLSVCDLVGCRGCLPTHFYHENGELKPEYWHIRSGEWSKDPANWPTYSLR